MNRKYVELDIRSIVVAGRIRGDLGDLRSLEESIRRLGLLFPVIVDRRNVLISGARRLEACRLAGLQSVPAWQVDAEARGMTALDIQSAENLCREALSGDDLEKLINSKKSALSSDRGFRAWLGRLFSPPAA
ncbi:MAG: hypothetical protein FJ225_04845 [Lentisphaerae bacterium]|nr:hypothetical protein [Lentisphaerota bacterium]